jgi:sulfur-carrier protein adenylyltransferase/sulfurtransferase
LNSDFNSLQFFDRQIKLPEVGVNGMEKLKSARVLVIGAGGLGCPALQVLALSGIGHIGICDDDLIEVSNLHRQVLFTINDIGQAKALVAKKRIKALNPWCEVTSFQTRFSEETAAFLIEEYDYILDCTDNLPTKFMLHDYSFRAKKVLVQSSIYQFEGELRCFDYRSDAHNDDLPCLRCLWPETPDQKSTATCGEVGVMGVVPQLFGTYQANEIIKNILSLNPLSNGATLTLDLLTYQQRILKWEKSDTCPLCSGEAMEKSTDINYYQNQDEEVIWGEFNKDDYFWIDIRTLPEKEEYPLPWPEDLFTPMHELESEIDNLEKLSGGKKILFFCQHGVRSLHVTQFLRQHKEMKEVYSLQSGIVAIN